MDDGQLIEQVEKFKHLFVKKNSLFKNKLARENAWKTIGTILETEAALCEQRWNVLRNKYCALKRQCKQTPSGSQSFTISWPYFESMKFLDQYILSRVRRISSLNPNTQQSTEQSTQQSDQWPGIYDIITPENTPEDLENFNEDSDPDNSSIPDTLTPTRAPTPSAGNILKRKNENCEGKSSKKKPSNTADSMSLAFTSLSNTLSTYVATKNKPSNIELSDRAFAESLAADLSHVKNIADKTYIKQQMFSLLSEYFRRLERSE